MVRGAVASLPDGVPARVLRADVQPLLRERARGAHRELRSANPRDVRRMEGSGRAGAEESARDGRTPQVDRARGDSVGARGGARDRRACALRRSLRRGSAQERAGALHREAGDFAQRRRTLAVVPGRTFLGLHHALHPHRLCAAQPPCGRCVSRLLCICNRVSRPQGVEGRQGASAHGEARQDSVPRERIRHPLDVHAFLRGRRALEGQGAGESVYRAP